MIPVAGSTEKVTIFSGVSCATSSMFMPPSVETTKATRLVSRSTSMEEVELGGDVRAVLDIQTVDLLAGRAGLKRDERAAEHLLREGLDLLRRAREANPALVAGLRLLELPLAASAGVDLRLHDPDRAGQFPHRRVHVGE